jgi:hypothetical protein
MAGKGSGIARRVVVAMFFAICPLGAAYAADEEIQVYMDEMNAPGRFALDVHVNYVPDGRLANVDYAGQAASDRRTRITPEFSLGLTPALELGLYLPLATIGHDGHFDAGGLKGRLKFIAPQPAGAHFFYGANFEIGRVDHHLDINPWNAELKGIGGYRNGRWTIAANVNFDFTVAGPAIGPASFQLATKVNYAIGKRLGLGLESYNDFGTAHRFGPRGDGDQQIFAIVETGFGHWELNFGVGRGYGRPEDKWIVKAIISVPIDGRAP